MGGIPPAEPSQFRSDIFKQTPPIRISQVDKRIFLIQKPMTKKFIIAIVVVVLIVIGAIFFTNRDNINLPRQPLTGELTVPEYVRVFLASSVEDNERVPVLVLSAVAGGGCDSASDLETKKSLRGDTLVVDIKGYKFTKGAGGDCPAVILKSRAKVSIDPDWLKQNGDKEIIFELGGDSNKYKISYSTYKVSLAGVQATNVITNRPGYNPSETPITLEMALYPIDVAVMYLAGSVSSAKDYRPAMRDFARTKGFTPAEEIYSGLEQNEKTQFYVVLKNRPMPEPNRGESLGELPSEGVGVYLKQVVSDTDHY
ncbi:MAG: hypothetical protein A3F85_02595 [Candidatus Ryanbacteria bacterium RIFCSPLOWO2_12_FULL_44_26]|nr:MAG: hypothetical protein A2718_04410 [Candidatus Ryanbacteria bacterium RIFCSPHIGHO2_01_FULL_44_130]OGZ55679.1 MAG: hypothetical protein A3F85_02595 [Candidatus Ryanbacteria bacterium RIFCSPLOWO2_12_FULL_44_26]